MSQKIEQILSQMTLEEKISLLAGADVWKTVPVDRLGIPAIKVTDGPNGARGDGVDKGITSACFPVGVALAATWNPTLVEQVGAALGEEVKAKNAHILLAPTVNIHRTPLAGRNFECYSEDPYLAGRMAVAYIKGVQSQGVGACIKHYVCNDSEFERMTISSEVPERALREIYLPPFRAAIKEAKPWAVMSAYNKLNGVYCSENAYTLLEILKDEWGYQGIVMSDWYGTYSTAVVSEGLDLEMPGPARWMGERALAQLESGQVQEAIIDDKVRRLLRVIERASAFEQPAARPERVIDSPEQSRVARKAAQEAIVLLKNEGPFLPLDRDKINSIAVIGENAKWAQIQGGGSAYVSPNYVVSPLDGIRRSVGEAVDVAYEVGCLIHKQIPLFNMDWMATSDGERGALTLEIFENLALSGKPIRKDVAKRADLAWFGETFPHIDPNNFSVRLSGTFTPPESGQYTLSLACAGRGRLFIDEVERVDLWTDRPPQESIWDMVEKTCQVELIAHHPYAIRVDFSPVVDTRWRGVRLGCLTPVPDDPITAAVELAASSDVALVFAGLTNEWESEGFDRPDMALCGDQVALIEQVAVVNPNTVVVLNTGAPIAMEWLDKVPALLQAWYTGQEAGNAIADVLFGAINPSGKLPTTFPQRLQDTPAYLNYPGENGVVRYEEGIFVGYRYYDIKGVAPLFPFGFGLSYTSFEFDNLQLSADQFAPDDVLEVSVDITNAGDRVGKEVVQLYVRDVDSRLTRPEKELKAFAKVELEPGETQAVTLQLDVEALAYFDDGPMTWVAEAGEYLALVGSSAWDIHAQAAFHLTATHQFGGPEKPHVHLSTKSTLRSLLEHKEAAQVLEKHLPGLIEHPQVQLAMDFSLAQIAEVAAEQFPEGALEAIQKDLDALFTTEGK